MELSCFKSLGSAFHSALPQDIKHNLLIEFSQPVSDEYSKHNFTLKNKTQQLTPALQSL